MELWNDAPVTTCEGQSRRGLRHLRLSRLPLLGGLVLVLACILPSLFPQWYVAVTQFFWTNLLFTSLLCLALFALLVWKS